VRHRIEHVVVQVDVELLAFKNESDSDVHAIIRGGRGFLMIAEFPDVFCTVGPYAQQMQQARQRCLQMAQQGVQRMGLAGVLFFDKHDGQLGGAPNGVVSNTPGLLAHGHAAVAVNDNVNEEVNVRPAI
jgi:hypothetical protein